MRNKEEMDNLGTRVRERIWILLHTFIILFIYTFIVRTSGLKFRGLKQNRKQGPVYYITKYNNNHYELYIIIKYFIYIRYLKFYLMETYKNKNRS